MLSCPEIAIVNAVNEVCFDNVERELNMHFTLFDPTPQFQSLI